MIYTVTFNPALDYAVETGDLNLGKTNRSENEKITAGGKGINVSTVLKNLGADSVALGFIAGFTGKEIERQTKALNITTDFIEIDGLSRINVKIRSSKETEINCSGPIIPDCALKKLYEKLLKLNNGDYLVLAGSVPSSLNKSVYADIMEMLDGRGVNVVVDATGELLGKVLPFHPFLIKPNTQELSEFFGVEIEDQKEAIVYAKKLQDLGARNVIVSMGADGAIMVSEKGEEYALDAPSGKVINTVGSGDSMGAGFVYATASGSDYCVAFKTAVASGSASAFCEGLADKAKIEEVLKTIK